MMSNVYWQVQVWFATSAGYNVVTPYLPRDEAYKRAREYWSDARGIKIVNIYGSSEQVKAEAN